MVLNNIFNQNAALSRGMRRDALQSKGSTQMIHMLEVIVAIQRAARTAVRTTETGVNGITQVNVSLSHVVASPALIVTAGG